MGDVVPLLQPSTPEPSAPTTVTAAPTTAGWVLDDWGRDATIAGFAARVLRLAWSVSVGGAERLAQQRSAMLVTNSRRFTLSPWFVALLTSTTERPVRFVGRPDAAPLGAIARRLGGVLERPDEVSAALAEGQIVVVAAGATLDPRKVGAVDPELIAVAVRAGVPIHPVATSLAPFSRSARIEIGTPLRPSSTRRGPFTELDLAERLQRRIADLIESSGTPRTGTPLDWIPMNPAGGA